MVPSSKLVVKFALGTYRFSRKGPTIGSLTISNIAIGIISFSFVIYFFFNTLCRFFLIPSLLSKSPTDVPSKPGVPEPVDWDVDRVQLKWAPPKSTNGAPITGYIVEAKEKGSTLWDEVLTTSVSFY